MPAPCPTRCAISSGSPIAQRTYKAYRSLLSSPRWQRIYNAGARPQRLLWASTGTKDPKASDVLYIKALAAPFTVNTIPEATLNALADHGELSGLLPADGGDGEEVLAQFAAAGVDLQALAVAAAGRRRRVVRQVVALVDGGDRVEERRARGLALAASQGDNACACWWWTSAGRT